MPLGQGDTGPSLWEGGQPDVQSKPEGAGVTLKARGVWWQPACSLSGSGRALFWPLGQVKEGRGLGGLLPEVPSFFDYRWAPVELSVLRGDRGLLQQGPVQERQLPAAGASEEDPASHLDFASGKRRGELIPVLRGGVKPAASVPGGGWCCAPGMPWERAARVRRCKERERHCCLHISPLCCPAFDRREGRMDPKSWPKEPCAGRTGRRRLLLQSWPQKSPGLKAQSHRGPGGSPPTPSALREEARPWEGKAQPAQGRRVAPAPSGQFTSKWLQPKTSPMPESPAAWSPARGTAGGLAAVATAEPARAMRPRPWLTSHRHWRRYLRDLADPRSPSPRVEARPCGMRWAPGRLGWC